MKNIKFKNKLMANVFIIYKKATLLRSQNGYTKYNIGCF